METIPAHPLSRFATATLYEAMGKRGDLDPALRPIGTARLFGPAFTVRCHIGDSRAALTAAAIAPAGSVIVIAAGGTHRSTVWGGSSTRAAMRRGVAGVLTDGAVRDTAEIRALGWPVFAAGAAVRGAVKNHPGWFGEPVSVGGAVIRPGDLIAADEDGVVVIPAADAEALLPLAERQAGKEAALDREIEAGADFRDLQGFR